MDLKFFVNVFQMSPHSGVRNGEALANFHIGETLGNQEEDFSFPLGY